MVEGDLDISSSTLAVKTDVWAGEKQFIEDQGSGKELQQTLPCNKKGY